MKIAYNRAFWKKYSKLSQNVQDKFAQRLKIFIKDTRNPVLKVHPLKGTLAGYRAFSITGDYRAIYKITSLDSIKLIDIGKHGQIYS